MKKNFYNDDFEDFLQDQLEGHRMYPSDSVWRGIQQNLHGEKKWPGLTIAAISIFTAMIFVSIYFTPSPNLFAIKPVSNSLDNNIPESSTGNLSNNAPYLNTEKNSVKERGNLLSVKTNRAVKPIIQDTNGATGLSEDQNASLASMVVNSNQNFVSDKWIISNSVSVVQNEKKINEEENKTNKNSASENVKSSTKSESNPIIINEEKEKTLVKAETNEPTSSPSKSKDYNDKNAADEFLKQHASDLSLFTTNKKQTPVSNWGYTIYFSPNVSYRKLKEDASLSKGNTGGPIAVSNFTDVNKIVRHKPGTGLEIGASINYSLSEKLRLKTGIQFSVRQYNIEAYLSNTEIAPITLIRNSGLDTVNTFAVYRTSNGYLYKELTNRYFQVSIPIGVEWEVIGNDVIQLNVAASVQPTYMANRDIYLLSTNFKNYTENSSMVRRWNVNTNIEAFISFTTGDFKWQVGPQIRYQNLPTFISQYPIKEHLVDYGIKLGISKSLH